MTFFQPYIIQINLLCQGSKLTVHILNRKVTQVKVRLLLQFPAKIKVAAFYYFMIHL